MHTKGNQKQLFFSFKKSYSCRYLLQPNLNPVHVDKVRYLGLYLDRRLKWNPHTRLIIQEMNKPYKL